MGSSSLISACRAILPANVPRLKIQDVVMTTGVIMLASYTGRNQRRKGESNSWV